MTTTGRAMVMMMIMASAPPREVSVFLALLTFVICTLIVKPSDSCKIVNLCLFISRRNIFVFFLSGKCYS